MVEKRRPGFNIPLNFYDGPEVESIPKRIRAAAVGVWALAGDYAATQLTDGYVGAGLLRQIGCTDAIRAALKVTINKKGELSPLWIDARNGGVQLTNWPKHQRTSDEVTTYRASEAERKRLEREAKRGQESAEGSTNLGDNIGVSSTNLSDNIGEDRANIGDESRSTVGPGRSSTSGNRETSGRTSVGQRPDVRSDARDPKTETETKTEIFGYVPESASLSTARDAIAATPGADLVREIIPATIPAAERTMLRIKASALLREGTQRDVLADALRLWLDKAHLGAGSLPSLVSEVIKTRAGPRNGHTARPSTADRRFADTQALKNQPTRRLEIET